MKLTEVLPGLTAPSTDDDKSIDYAAAGLYLPAAQTIFATTLSAVVSVVACWLIPVGAISAVRTLALTATSGVLVIRKPIKVGNTRGINTIFSALRPCCFIYVCCLVLEQLVHTCVSEESTYEHGYVRRIIYHLNMTLMTIAAFMRSRSPRAEHDLPFAITTLAVLVVAMLPPPALALSGPLCSPPTLYAAAERVLRAFMFSSVYVTLVYSAAPISNNLSDTIICIARSSAASTWILGAVVYSLPLALLQICVVLYCAFSPSGMQYEGVAVCTGDADASEPHAARPRVASPAESERTDEEALGVRPAAIAVRGIAKQTMNGSSLTFNLASVGDGCNAKSSVSEQARMAEVAASIP